MPDLPAIWATFVGVNQYEDRYSTLPFCANDANEIAQVFTEISAASTDGGRPHIRLLTDSQEDRRLRPTKANILRAVEDMTKVAGPDDRLVFGFFGHGEVSGGRSYLLPMDALAGKADGTALAIDWLAETLSSCRARFKLVLLDACHSGALHGRDGAKTMSDAFLESLRKLGSSEGWAVFASSKLNECSYDDPALQHGVFSYFLIQGLRGEARSRKDEPITLGPLADYVTSKVLDWSYRNGRNQTPELHSQVAGTFSIVAPQPDKTIWLSVMGTKGGAGKSTIVTAMAELIASTGKNVLLIDADMEATGLTKYLEGRAQQQPYVRTVMDVAYQKAGDTSMLEVPWGAWDVTPRYLRKDRFGKINLAVARRKNDGRDAWLPLARIQPDERRNSAALEILEDLYREIRASDVPVDCVIVDAGAENNPLVSAAVARSRYSYLVSSPNPEFRFEIQRLEGMHRSRYPTHTFEGMNVVVNRATPESADLWKNQQNVYFVQEDPIVQRTSALGRDYDFEGVGLNRFFRDVLRVLNDTFRKSDDASQYLPDESDVWIAPFLRELPGTPQRILRHWYYRFAIPALLTVLFLGTLLVGLGVLLFARTARDVSAVETTEPMAVANGIDNQALLESGAALAADLKGKLYVEAGRITLRGEIPEEVMRKLQISAGVFPEYQVALVRASLKHAENVKVAIERQNMKRTYGIASGLLGLAAIVGGTFALLVMRRRKSLLRNVVKLEAADPAELKQFAEQLLLAQHGKSHLVWLRSQLRANAPQAVQPWFVEGEEHVARLSVGRG